MKKINKLKIALLSLMIISPLAMAKEPQNLSLHKQTLIQYHDSGQYMKELDNEIDQAMRYLKQYLALSHHDKKPAIVLDIDETSLSNYPDMVKMDFGGTIDQIREDEDKGQDLPIKSTLNLYQFAKAHHIAVFFITGRFEKERAITAINLKNAGFTHWDGLILRAGKYEQVQASVYKPAMRKKITEQGYTIILNIGDQQSDLTGGYADKTIKLPNPYYFIA